MQYSVELILLSKVNETQNISKRAVILPFITTIDKCVLFLRNLIQVNSVNELIAARRLLVLIFM